MHTPNQEEKLKEILSVASSFGNRDQDAKTLRSAGICLFFSQYGLDSEEKKKEYRATSIEYLERSLQMSDIIDEGRASTLLVLGDFFSYEEKYEKALEALDRSLDCFPASESSNSGDEHAKHEIMVEIQTERGCMLWKLQKRDAALDALNKARSLAKDTKFWILDHITTIIDEIDTASDGHKLMEALKSWSEKERFDWFGGNISYGDVAAFCRMYRAAKAADETPLVLQWLNDFEKTLLPTSSSRLGLGLVTAVFHEKVLDDKEKAKETLRQTLTIQSKNDENDKNELELIISQVRATLASIIFTQFRDTSDPQRKDDLLKEMKNLPGMTTDDEFRESHIGMLVVHM